MATTLSGTYTTTQFASGAVTLTSTGVVDVANGTGGAFGQGNYPTPASLTNLGLIKGFVALGGTNNSVINSSSISVTRNNNNQPAAAVILGHNGVLINSGNVASYLTNSVSGYNIAARVELGSTVENTGTLSATGANGTGLNLQGAIEVVNGGPGSGAGSITGSYNGITGFVGENGSSIVNFGTIQGSRSGISLRGSGIYLGNSTTITNSGVIAGDQAVVLNDGGSVFNGQSGSTAGLIQGGSVGVYIGNRAAPPDFTVANFGTISATGAAPTVDAVSIGYGYVTLANSGTILAGASGGSATATAFDSGSRGTGAAVVNSGLIDAAYGAKAIGARMLAGTVENTGTVTASGATAGIAIILGGSGVPAAGSLNNSGLISGSSEGIDAYLSGLTLTNSGIISGGTGYGINLGDGSITNSTSGTIRGGTAVRITGGQSFQAPSALSNAGTIVGVTGISILAADTGNNTIVNSGTISGRGGTAIAFGGGDDRLIVLPGATFSGIVDGGQGNNTIELAAGTGTLAGFGSSITRFGTVVFDANAAWTVAVDDTTVFTGTFTGFAIGDAIDLTHIVADGESFGNGQLTLTSQGAVTAKLDIQGSLTSNDVALTSDGAGGTDITITTGAAPPSNPPDSFTPQGLTFATTTGQGFSGVVATFTDSNTLTGSGALNATIDWGDGTLTSGTVSGSDGSFSVSGSHAYTTAGQDNIAVTLADNPPGTASATATSTATIASGDLGLVDTTTGQTIPIIAVPYTGPVAGLQQQYIYAGTDSVNISVTSDNWFLKSGPGEDAIQAFGGYNVLDGSTGSNFLTGGSGGSNTFFVDDRAPPSDIWSTVNNFHQGDDATLFGVVPSGSNTFQWADGQGAVGYTGLTLHVFTPNAPTASLTLPGYSSSDLGNGRLTVQFGSETDGTPFMHIIASG